MNKYISKLEIKIPKVYEPKNNPIKSPGFLNWLRKKREKRRKNRRKKKEAKIQEIEKNKQKNFRYKKIIFAKFKQNAKWCKIKKYYIIYHGVQPPFVIKDWFFNY